MLRATYCLLRERATCFGQQTTCCRQQATCCPQHVACCPQHVARPRNLLPRNMLRWCKRGLKRLIMLHLMSNICDCAYHRMQRRAKS